MSRSWKDIKADKQAIDEAAGRDVAAESEHARTLTQAYILANRPVLLVTTRHGGSR